MPGLHLNQLIEASLSGAKAGAMEKIAQEGGTKTCKGCGRPAVAGSELCKECAEKAAKGEERAAQTEETEKTSSENIEKMASGLRWMVDNPGSWLPVAGRIKMAEDNPPNTTGPGRGPNTLETDVSSPTSEQMPATLNPGGAAKHSIPTSPPMEAGANPKAAPRTMQTDIKKDRPLQPEDGDLIQKGAAVNLLKRAMLKKAQDGDTSSISTPKTSALPEDQPSQMARPAEVTGQERMIASNEAAIDFTKREAKAVPKKRMGEVLDEPAQSKSGDSALHDALGADLVAKGGAKVASARLVQKLASEGCTCSGNSRGSCGFCKVASQVEQTLRERADAHYAAAQGNGQ